MTRIYAGCGTRNWSLRTAEGRFFVKEYPAQTRVAEERQALELSIYARDCGIPTPMVIATRSDDLICASGDALFALFEWADGCTAKGSLSLEQMAHAGRVLGDVHRHFSMVESRLPSETSRWLDFDAADKLSEVERYVEVIRGKPERDDFDRKTLPLLIERKRLVREVRKILQALSSLTTQVMRNKWMERPSDLIREYSSAQGFRPRKSDSVRSSRLDSAAHTKHVRRQKATTLAPSNCKTPGSFWSRRAHAARRLFANLTTVQETRTSVRETVRR